MSVFRQDFDPRRYPRLANFAEGYLHQDLAVEHVTPERAREAFLADSSPEDTAGFMAEAARFLALTAGWHWHEVLQAWSALGGAWVPGDRRALERVLARNPHKSKGRS